MVTPLKSSLPSDKSRTLPPSILGDQLRWWPFPQLRPYQTKVLRLLKSKYYLILNAPTGFGKSVLTIAGIWYRHIWGDRQLFLFSKTKAQLRSVFLKNLKNHFSLPPSDQLTVIPLISRKDLCSSSSRDSCRGCPAKSRARYLSTSHLLDLIQAFSLGACPDSFLGYRKHLSEFGCPYDLIRRMVPRANIVLLTQGYLETISLREVLESIFLTAGHFGFPTSSREVIIDEAHNFGPTIESQLSRDQLLRASEIGPFPVVDSLIKLLDEPLGRVFRPRSAMPKFSKQIHTFLNQRRIRKYLPPEDYDVLHAVRTFIERRGQYWVLNETGLAQLNAWPEEFFDFLRLHFSRIILLSGTFHNLSAYHLYYGLSKGDIPFTRFSVPLSLKRRRQLFLGALYHPSISSKDENRNPDFYQWLAEVIHILSLLANDHTIIFVPSYEILDELFPLLQDRLRGQLPLYREPTKGRIPYLEKLFTAPPSVIMAVYGGKFSEGIEIRHSETGRSRVQLVICAGLPFPPPNPEYKLLEQLYHCYRIPLFIQLALLSRNLYTQVLQCLGRAIRSEQDHAAAVILDYRAVRRLRLPGMRVFTTRDQLIFALAKVLLEINEQFQVRT